MRRVLVITGALGAVILLSAQAAVNSFPVRVEVVVLGLVGVVVWWAGDQARQLLAEVKTIVKQFPQVTAALWGAPDPEGNRHGGLIADVHEVKEAISEMQRGREG